MCRWMAYSGAPITISRLLYEPRHSLIDQSLHAREGVETTNGDGFGIGWYADGHDAPGRYRSVSPAWNDMNLADLASHIDATILFAHIRAATGTAVQHTNCHPFRAGNWLFMHNGAISGFEKIRRDMMSELDDAQFNAVAGTTDSELLFALALTYGMRDDPVAAMEAAVGFVEDRARIHDISDAIQLSAAISDGTTMWAIRYSTVHDSRTLYVSEDIETLRALYPGNDRLREISGDARLIVSEPISEDIPGAWKMIPESTAVVVRRGERPSFMPFAPAAIAVVPGA